MPFALTNLRRVDWTAQNANVSISLFGYVTPDAAAVVEAANYFNPGATLLAKGDVIQAVMVIAGTPILKHYVVTSATGATPVTVAIQTTTAG